MHPALGDLAQGLEHRLDGVGLVGVVDDREVGLAGVHALQASGDSGHGGDAVGGGLRVEAGHGEGDDGGEGVRHVEGARDRRPGGDPLALGSDRGERGVHGADLHVLGTPVGVGVALGREGDDRDAGFLGEPAAVLVVDVDDAESAAFRCEQLCLGPEVVLHVGVELHVLRAEVGEHPDVEDAAVDPAEDQRVAGDLHGDRLDTAFAHDGEQGLQVGGFGGGALGLDALVTDAHLDRADEPGGAGRLQTALDEVGGGGLAGGAGDADLEQVPAGVAVDRGRQFAHPAPRVLDDQDRQSGRGGPLGAGRVGQHGDRAEAGGLRDEVGAVQTGTREGGVQVTGADGTRVMGDARDLDGLVGAVRRGGTHLVGEFREGCGGDLRRPGRPGIRHGMPLLGGLGLISVWHGGERTGRTRL